MASGLLVLSILVHIPGVRCQKALPNSVSDHGMKSWNCQSILECAATLQSFAALTKHSRQVSIYLMQTVNCRVLLTKYTQTANYRQGIKCIIDQNSHSV